MILPHTHRSGSRQQSRAQSRGSVSRPESREVVLLKAERRSRASTSHLVSTEDEFVMPAQFDPALNDLYASDDEDIEVIPGLRLLSSAVSQAFCSYVSTLSVWMRMSLGV